MSIKLDPGYGPAYGNRARIFRDKGHRARAFADFEKSLQLDRGNDRDAYARANAHCGGQ